VPAGVKDGLNGKWFCMFDTREPARRSGMPLTRVIKRQTLVELFQAGLSSYGDRVQVRATRGAMRAGSW
jgi:hypothetical protein